MHLFRCMNNNIYSLNAYTLYKCTYILHTEQKLPIPRVGRKWYILNLFILILTIHLKINILYQKYMFFQSLYYIPNNTDTFFYLKITNIDPP